MLNIVLFDNARKNNASYLSDLPSYMSEKRSVE